MPLLLVIDAIGSASNESIRILSISYLTLLSYFDARFRSVVAEVSIADAMVRSYLRCMDEEDEIASLLEELDKGHRKPTVKTGMYIWYCLQLSV
jgi:hypothetical protein